MEKQHNLLIYTDLDGSLLDHFTYSFAPAQPLLCSLQKSKIPVIPTTSKTFSELITLRKNLKNKHPFIVENGAAAFIPLNYFNKTPLNCEQLNGFYVHCFSQRRDTWIALLNKLSRTYKNEFIIFSEAGTSGITEMTGLDPKSAAQANKRDFSEPVFWKGSLTRKKSFINELESNGATVLQGGRFLHVTGNCNKAKALHWLTEEYHRQYSDTHFHTLAVGDSDNDTAMLEAANHAIQIRSPVHPLPDIKNTNCYTSQLMGPEGWAEGVFTIAKEFIYEPGQVSPINR